MAPIAPLLALFGTAGAGSVGAGLSAGVGAATAGAATASSGILGTIASWLPTVGTALTAGGTVFAGARANQMAQQEAKLLKKRGDEEFAVAQRDAIADKTQARLMQSRARAVAAASGGAVADRTVEDILAGIGARGDYNAKANYYMGATRRNNMYAEASMSRSRGKDALVSSIIDAGGTLFSDRYRRGYYG